MLNGGFITHPPNTLFANGSNHRSTHSENKAKYQPKLEFEPAGLQKSTIYHLVWDTTNCFSGRVGKYILLFYCLFSGGVDF